LTAFGDLWEGLGLEGSGGIFGLCGLGGGGVLDGLCRWGVIGLGFWAVAVWCGQLKPTPAANLIHHGNSLFLREVGYHTREFPLVKSYLKKQ